MRAEDAPPPAARTPTNFPLGVFEDANLLGGKIGKFKALIADCQAHGLDSVWLTNGSAERDAAMLAAGDEARFNVYFLPSYELGREFLKSKPPVSAETARAVVRPIAERLKNHASLKGYVLADEPGLNLKDHMVRLAEAFHEADPARPVFPVLIGTDRVGPIFEAARPDVLAIDVYPCGAENKPGDFTLTGFGYKDIDFVQYVRTVAKGKPREVPLWFILQTHKFLEPGQPFALREPTVAEVRLQAWLAVGEGARGIFWFVYGSQQGWKGLPDNPPLYAEVAAQAARLRNLREILMRLYRADAAFAVEGGKAPYVSTFTNATGRKKYAVVANTDCEAAQKIAVKPSAGAAGQLRDMETGKTIPLGEAMELAPGDGKVLEFVLTSPATK
jgi:hypothetical protein